MTKEKQLRLEVTEFAKGLDLPPVVHEINELINQMAWDKAAEHEKQAMLLISQMWKVVQLAAKGDCSTETYYEAITVIERAKRFGKEFDNGR